MTHAGTPAAVAVLSEDERETLQRWARRPKRAIGRRRPRFVTGHTRQHDAIKSSACETTSAERSDPVDRRRARHRYGLVAMPSESAANTFGAPFS